jgi:hypothetical protein
LKKRMHEIMMRNFGIIKAKYEQESNKRITGTEQQRKFRNLRPFEIILFD